jgi:hypothetical protein
MDGNLWTEVPLTSNVPSFAAVAAMAGSGAASARVVAALWRCCKLAVTAKSNAMARRLVLTTTAGGPTLLCNDGRRPKFFVFFFFFIRQFQESKKEKKGRALKPVSRLWWLA